MAAADLRDELSCSICLSIYTDPVMMPCGHNFCRGCIERVLGTQEGSGAYSCPECRAEYEERPALPRNRTLGNIAERFLSSHPEHDGTGIYCTYCIHSPVPAAKSCLNCEASLCDDHVRVHSKSAEHILTEPTSFVGNRKCSTHDKVLEYYCWEESVCVCVSCCLAGEHRGHRVLSEASEKKKETLRHVLENLSPQIEENEKRILRLQELRRDVEGKAAGDTETVTALFRDIKEWWEVLEKRLLSKISKQKEEHSLQLSDLMQKLEIKKDELPRKIHQIEELCNMADPLTVLQESDRVADGYYINVPAVGDLDVDQVSETLLTGLAEFSTWIKGRIYGEKVADLLLDIKTTGYKISVSGDKKTALYSKTEQRYSHTPERFQDAAQVLSTKSFSSGRHYWEVEGSEMGDWEVGVAYTSIERRGDQTGIGSNNKSWSLCRWGYNCSKRHDGNETKLDYVTLCRRIRISLDYEAGRLSFYELSEPIRHLHTFTATFTEPLHAAFHIFGWGGNASIRIIS